MIEKIVAGFMMAILLCGALAFVLDAKPSKQDIQKCVKVTNYTAKRCQWEMTR